MDIHLPTDLDEKFSKLSQANTQERRETGGIIAGEKMNGYYQVTHLIIPEQTGSSITWEVHDERQITNYFVYNPNLIMLGLIHTHPNMTSFLSSVDLHALWDYARDNPSLISIVLAPELAKCKEVGFHHHTQDDQMYYKEADYVVDDQTFTTEVMDFRLHV
jgi:STAM-binding protein